MAKKVYAVKEGFDSEKNIRVENLIVNTWAECLKYVKGVKGAKYKSFESRLEAEEFLNSNNAPLKKEEKNYPMDCLHVYVDGSYNIASEEYAYGLVALKNGVIEYIDGGIGLNDSSRNIRQIAGELDATIKGVEYAIEKGESKVVIFHDYIGICYHATGFWERKEESSKKYYEKMQDFFKKGIEIIFVKVDSHTGDLYNELADEICKEKLGIQSEKVVEKYLANNTIRVKDFSLKEKIKLLISKGENNIILEEDKKSNTNNYNAFKEIKDLYNINSEIAMNKIATLNEKEKNSFIEYLLKLNG